MRLGKRAQDPKSKILSAMLSKRAQEEKISSRNFFNLTSLKRGQEEMVGFAIILVIVAVILLVVIASSLNNSDNENVESYEVSGFVQSMLQYTSGCEGQRENYDIQDLIFECEIDAECLNDRNSCEVLNSTLENILEKSWQVGEKYPAKGYELVIVSNEEGLINISKGTKTKNVRGDSQDFSRSLSDMEIYFSVYY